MTAGVVRLVPVVELAPLVHRLGRPRAALAGIGASGALYAALTMSCSVLGPGAKEQSMSEFDPLLSPQQTDPAPDEILVVFGFDHPLLAQEALLATMRLQDRKHLDLDDAAIVHKEDAGRVRIVQTRDVSVGQGALSGSWWGLIAGLFVPAGPLIGAALGAAVGGLFAKLRDIGIDDDEMRRIGDDLEPGESALFLLIRDCHQARALHEVSRFPGRLVHTTAEEGLADQIRERLAVDPWA